MGDREKQNWSKLNFLFSPRMGGDDYSKFFLAGPPRGKSRPNLKARLKTNSPQICEWARMATSGWRAQTWCRLNNHTSTRLCKAAGAPPPSFSAAPRMHFAANTTAMRAHTHIHAHPKLL